VSKNPKLPRRPQVRQLHPKRPWPRVRRSRQQRLRWNRLRRHPKL